MFLGGENGDLSGSFSFETASESNFA